MSRRGNVGGGRRILVVDDDDDLRATVCELLEDAGYQPTGAQNGQVALQKLRQGTEFGVVLLDLMMPTMDGWQFRNVQLADPAIADVPVVVMTASRELALNPIRASAILYKPIALEILLDTVDRFFAASPTDSA